MGISILYLLKLKSKPFKGAAIPAEKSEPSSLVSKTRSGLSPWAFNDKGEADGSSESTELEAKSTKELFATSSFSKTLT